MAKQTTLVDDINESTDDVQSVQFEFGGKTFELDLDVGHRDELAAALRTLEEFAHYGREVRHRSAYARLTPSQRRAIRADLKRKPRTTISDEDVAKWLASAKPVPAEDDEPF